MENIKIMKYLILVFFLLNVNVSVGQWLEKEDTYWDAGCTSGYAGKSFQMLNDSVGYREWAETPTPSAKRMMYAKICDYGNSPTPPPDATFGPSWLCSHSPLTPYFTAQYVSGPWKLQLFNIDTLLYIEEVWSFTSTIHVSFDALATDSIIFSTVNNELISDYYFFDVFHGFISLSSSSDLLIEYNNGILDTIYSLPTSYSTKIQFINDSLGFLQREDLSISKKRLMKSTDIGQNWTPVFDSLTSNLKSIKFVTDSIGFINLSDNSIYKTLDQGNTWNAITIDYNRFQGVYEFITEDLWYAVANSDSLFKTYDQGNYWVYDSLTFNNITNIEIRSDSLGYAIGNTCKLYTKGKNNDVTSVNLLNVELTDFELYPNPVRDVLSFNYPKFKNIQKINIIDYSGKLIKSFTPSNNSINVTDLNQGLYFFQLFTNETIITKKFIKQ